VGTRLVPVAKVLRVVEVLAHLGRQVLPEAPCSNKYLVACGLQDSTRIREPHVTHLVHDLHV